VISEGEVPFCVSWKIPSLNNYVIGVNNVERKERNEDEVGRKCATYKVVFGGDIYKLIKNTTTAFNTKVIVMQISV
jgi:SepF-like predicted cell division protein (DUF552 family)